MGGAAAVVDGLEISPGPRRVGGVLRASDICVSQRREGARSTPPTRAPSPYVVASFFPGDNCIVRCSSILPGNYGGALAPG